MTRDQHENPLTTYYSKVLETTRTYLQSRYTLEDGQKDDKDVKHVSQLKPRSVIWRITVSGTKRSFTFLIAIPLKFPDYPPKFYLGEKDFLDFKTIPHVNKNREVCTRDPAIIVLNDSCPGQALEELLHIAIEILEVGIVGGLKKDFKDEFLAYWNDQAESRMILIGPVLETPSIMTQFEVIPSLFGCSFLVALSKSEAAAWLTRLAVKTQLQNPAKVICIHLPEVPASVPVTIQDIKGFMTLLDTISTRYIKSFCGNHILASVPSNQDLMFFSWQHPLLPVRGFRRKVGSVPLYLSISNPEAKNVKVVKFQVKRFDRDRLIRRTINMNVITERDFRLAIIGCGSVGSTLSMLLAKSGCRYFTLVDPDELTEENVARHLCGCSAMVATPKKVQAVKHAVESHLPFVRCEALDGDILDLLSSSPQAFADTDLMLITAANMGVERRVNDFFVLERPKPVVYIWLEPYAVAGHILYILPNSGGCYRCCFDSNGNFRLAVAENNQVLNKREAGCQQTFTPYGAADLDVFCGVACKEIIRVLHKPPTRSCLTTWIGDMEQFKSAGHRIKDDYSAHYSYSVHRRDINSQETCELCNKKA
jgi:molybdopterin/thiamine biosynthesis adenylyltransferase